MDRYEALLNQLDPQGVAEAYDGFGKFDAAEFQRHMEKLRAREELRKTDPMKALVGDLIDKDREKEALAKRKKPEDDSIGINDPRHPGYAYTQMGQTDLNEFAPGNGDDDRPTAEYEVYQCQPDNQFDWIGGPLMQTDDMGKAHGFAHFLWKKHPDKCFMIWQERSQGSRGGYGPEGSVLGHSEEVDESSLKNKLAAAALAGAMATGAHGVVVNPNRVIDAQGHSAANPYGNTDSTGNPIKKSSNPDAERLKKNTDIVDKEQRKNHHQIPTNEDYLDE